MKNKLNARFLLGALTLVFNPAFAEYSSGPRPTKKKHVHQHAHVHGVSELTLALEDEKNATLRFESPAESILGFEHQAKSNADLKAQSDALAILNKAADLFVFEKALGCSVTPQKVEVDSEDHDKDHEKDKDKLKGEHSEVEAEYKVVCAKSLSGSVLLVEFGKFFPKIEKLKVQILKDQGQSAIEIKKGKGDIRI